METKKKGSRLAVFISGLYVLAALVLLLGVCSHCYPTFQSKMKELFAGMEDGAVRQAFGTLAEGLENGEPVRETLAETAQVLFHEKG